jgi:Tol biopolymer transport system component
LLLAHFYAPGGLWVYDLERQLLRRQTFRGPTANTVWGPKEGYFTYSADTQGASVKKVDTGPDAYERLPRGSSRGRSIIPGSWDPNGEWLAGVTFPGIADICLISSDGQSKSFFTTAYREEFPDFSPDGKWLLYTSTESGQAEVYVRAFPGPGTAVQISTEGGYAAAWARDGKEVYYRAFGGGFQAVRIRSDNGQLRVDRPEELFKGNYPDAFPTRAWDIAPDGRFLLIKGMDEASWKKVFEEAYPDRIRIEQNWLDELKTLVP